MSESTTDWSKGAIAIGVLAAGLGVGYYYGLYLPNRDQSREAATRECLKAVMEQYTIDWESNCRQLKLGKSCKLPQLIANQNEERRHQNSDECYRFNR
jgi:hypothetical protein